MAKEILKLKKQNMEGLIIDLRNNGGGSMQEAMALAGIFIDEGPLGVLKHRNEKPFLLRDMNRGTIYDGPLILLVNGLSASASEFLSSVLQDYHRALIIGSTTFGKGTGQDMMLVDSTEKFSASPKHGYLKLTDFKFYHVNCSTNQCKGVVPDIALPDLYMNVSYFKETGELYHMDADTVIKKVVYESYASLPVDFLSNESRKRQEKNLQFRKIRNLAYTVKLLYETGIKVPLNKKSVRLYFDKIDTFEKQIEDLNNYSATGFRASNNQYFEELLRLDPFRKDENEKVLKDIQSDAELEEAFLMLSDLVNYHKTK